jgi:AbrB family looped-hinge helix DNA binding protein
MRTTFATVSAKGQLVIPSEMRSQLGIKVGTRVALNIEGNHIVLQPVTRRLADELYGITAGTGSMADELIAERREEDKRRDESLDR